MPDHLIKLSALHIKWEKCSMQWSSEFPKRDKDYASLLCLPSGSEALLYHLSELKGMALWKQKYESLGLDASGIEGTVVCVCYLPTLISLLKHW